MFLLSKRFQIKLTVKTLIDVVGTIILLIVAAIVFGPYMIMDRLFFKSERYLKKDQYGWY